MKRFLSTVLLLFIYFNCFSQKSKVQFNSNNQELTQAFVWAKQKALSFAHDNTDPVGYWYEAALPNREAFCMRDVSHQSIGAEILGLGKHNYNMFLKFAQNISKEKDYASYWEINRHNKPAPVDFENDKDFWYNLPANFDVIYNAYRLYKWTGNKNYISNPDLWNFYQLSVNEYVNHWKLNADKITTRDRNLYSEASKRFKNKRGIPTYNEGGRGDTFLGIDMTASLIAAYKSYAAMAKIKKKYVDHYTFKYNAENEQKFLNDYWWDNSKNRFKSIVYTDGSFDYFMVGDNQAFLHYLLYFDALEDTSKKQQIVNDYKKNYKKLIVELKSYLPIIFYEFGETEFANNMIIELASQNNKRRDYPENSYTIIEHITRGLMGISGDPEKNMVSTTSRLSKDNSWAEINYVPIINKEISVKHEGALKTTFTNHSKSEIYWKIQFPKDVKKVLVKGDEMKILEGKKYNSTIVYVLGGLTYTATLVK